MKCDICFAKWQAEVEVDFEPIRLIRTESVKAETRESVNGPKEAESHIKTDKYQWVFTQQSEMSHLEKASKC